MEKELDWNRIMVADPRNRMKLLALTPEGLERAERIFRELFEHRPSD